MSQLTLYNASSRSYGRSPTDGLYSEGRGFVPKGRCENSPTPHAGHAEAEYLSPEGRPEPASMTPSVSRPFGTGPSKTAFPGVETPGYCHLSRRDNNFGNFQTGFGPATLQISHSEKFDKSHGQKELRLCLS